MNKLTLFT